MALNDLSKNVQDFNDNAHELFEQNYEYYKLNLFKKITKGISAMVQFALIVAVLSLGLFMLSMALGYALGAWLENVALAFVLIGIFYIIVAVLIFTIFRKPIERKILIIASKEFYD
ncbi:phage holin family protein [Robertkochia solimangrovi]|uniref:phage holin family protein n=1 Tax=Robertkochia solimangrovi TaxID=2213046 RepID=UPI00117E1647|nr:phage holin family protein [Robertkochia solimangrovi]TRZ46054.1 hypothetical protein DMZ48_01935 [Robertkochia solimangrovi]